MLYRTRKRASSARAARAPRDELRAGDSGQVTWYRRRVPVWGAASGAIAAGLIIAIGIGPLLSDGSKSPRITTYRDDPHIYFSPMPAGGLGFFSDASTKPEAFNGVSVAIDGPALTLAWPPIRQSTTYTLNLFYYDGRDHTALQRFVSDAPSVSIERNLLQSGKRYEWVLSGVDQDGEYFTAQGGFILTD